jgi:hypothetical protein
MSMTRWDYSPSNVRIVTALNMSPTRRRAPTQKAIGSAVSQKLLSFPLAGLALKTACVHQLQHVLRLIFETAAK